MLFETIYKCDVCGVLGSGYSTNIPPGWARSNLFMFSEKEKIFPIEPETKKKTQNHNTNAQHVGKNIKQSI